MSGGGRSEAPHAKSRLGRGAGPPREGQGVCAGSLAPSTTAAAAATCSGSACARARAHHSPPGGCAQEYRGAGLYVDLVAEDGAALRVEVHAQLVRAPRARPEQDLRPGGAARPRVSRARVAPGAGHITGAGGGGRSLVLHGSKRRRRKRRG